MWGFVSVMLVLLFMFVPTSTDTPRQIPVDLPTAYHSTPMPGAIREDAMQVIVERDGRVFFGNHQIVVQDLVEEIHSGIRNGAEERVYLNADARAKYSDVKAVLNQIRMAGIVHVSLLTQNPYR